MVLLEMREQHRVPNGHIEVDRWRDLFEIAYRGIDRISGGFPRVEVQRSALLEHEVEVVVAAKGVIPRKPVDEHRWRLLHERPALLHHLLIGAEHPVRVDHCFWESRRPGREQVLRHGVGRELLGTGCQGGPRRCREELFQRNPQTASGLRADDIHLLEGQCVQYPLKRGNALYEDQAWTDAIKDAFHLLVIARQQGVGWRDRRDRDAGEKTPQHQQRVVDGISGEHHHRSIRIEPQLEQRLADRLGRAQRVRVMHQAPALTRSLAKERLIRPLACPTA